MAYTWSATLWYEDVALATHTPLGLARMLWQYRGQQPRIQAFLETYLDELQSAEDVTYDVLVGMWPLTAIGVQLDNLGDIVGQDRGGLVDEEYRLFILGRIFVNKGDGQWPQFFELMDILGYTETMVGYEFWPACFEFASTSMSYADTVGDLLFDLKGGGIAFRWAFTTYADTDTFKTATTLAADEADADEGTENLAGTTGGRLVDLRWE
jgi:hypothetical protein